jgi:hypothetical protein
MIELITHIYTLHNPNGELRYAGKTSLTLKGRFARHLSDARRGSNTHCSHWVKGLLDQGLEPEMSREIKRLLLEGKMLHREIAELYGVSRGNVGQIQRNLRWARVPWPESAVVYPTLPQLLDLRGSQYESLEMAFKAKEAELDDDSWLN